MKNNILPCIVLGLETQIGLSVIRELGRAGVYVIGIAQSDNALGLCSRYLSEGIVLPPRSEELIVAIKALGEKWGTCPLLAISEVNLQWLSKNRANFGNVVPVLPSDDALSIVLDKQATLTYAKQVDIEIPKSFQPTQQDNLSEIVELLPLPAVLKWSDPNAVSPILSKHGIELIKAEYAYTKEQLLATLQRYQPVGQWPLVQEYCAGYGLGQFFFMHRGDCLRRFQHQRVAEWPPEGGFSSVCDAIPLSEYTELQEKSIAMLRKIGWEGVAMVEYRYDPIKKRAVLMEINGRFWGSYPLAMHAHADFALLAYRVAAALPTDTTTWHVPQQKLRCRMVATELKRLVRICLSANKIADKTFKPRPLYELFRFFSDFFRLNVCYYVWSIKDPKPFFKDVQNALRHALNRQ